MVCRDFLSHAGVTETADVIYLIDGSGAVDTTTFNKMKNLVDASFDFYNISKDATNIGLVQFGESAEIVLRPKDGRSKWLVKKHASALSRPGGLRLINKALGLIRTDLIEKPGEVRRDGKKVIVLVTTGMNAPRGANYLAAEADNLRTRGVHTVVLSLGNVANENELTTLADRDFVKVDSTDMLPQSFGLLERKIDEAGGKKLIKYLFTSELLIPTAIRVCY